MNQPVDIIMEEMSEWFYDVWKIEYWCIPPPKYIPVRLDDVLIWAEKKWYNIIFSSWICGIDLRKGSNCIKTIPRILGKNIYEQTPETQQQLSDFITKCK